MSAFSANSPRRTVRDWYRGELGFFDNYIIPLAKKLKACNVFGVSSDECLNYALQNRQEWEERRQSIVDELVQLMENEYRIAAPCSETATDSAESEEVDGEVA